MPWIDRIDPSAPIADVAGIIFFTREVNLPLNATTESWKPGAPPTDWRVTRDAWNAANDLRTIVSFAAFLLATTALTLRSERRNAGSR